MRRFSILSMSKSQPSFAVEMKLARRRKTPATKKSQCDESSDHTPKEEVKEDQKLERPLRRKSRLSGREICLLGLDSDHLEDDDLNESSDSLHSSNGSLFMTTMGIDRKARISLVRTASVEFANIDVTSDESKQEEDLYNIPFESMYRPDEMRCLALVAHNHMKPAMKEFVLSHKEVLKKFRLTGTNTTMTMLRSVFGDDPSVKYGPTCKSGPLGGDAELCALMCLEDLGGIIFFQDPLSAHPHQADIDSLVRLANVHNVITAPNPASAHSLSFVLKCALAGKRKDMIPSFFYTLESPGVAVYKGEQQKQIENNV